MTGFTPELVDCPFCGCHASMYSDGELHWAQCDMCSARSDSGKYPDCVRDWWNMRFEASGIAELTEALREAGDALKRANTAAALRWRISDLLTKGDSNHG